MTQAERADAMRIVAACYSLYGRETSPDMLAMFVAALDHYPAADIRRALNEHVRNPDTGMFPPKPADVVRALQGSTETQAMQAWSEVERAIRHLGPYRSITFADPVAMRVIADMGGWIKLCEVTDKDLPFRAKEFETRYRGYAARGEAPESPALLPGIAARDNGVRGLPAPEPVAVGRLLPGAVKRLEAHA